MSTFESTKSTGTKSTRFGLLILHVFVFFLRMLITTAPCPGMCVCVVYGQKMGRTRVYSTSMPRGSLSKVSR